MSKMIKLNLEQPPRRWSDEEENAFLTELMPSLAAELAKKGMTPLEFQRAASALARDPNFMPDCLGPTEMADLSRGHGLEPTRKSHVEGCASCSATVEVFGWHL